MLSGCKTTQKHCYNRVKVRQKKYVPLLQVCAKHNLSWDWDGFAKVVTVKNFNTEVRFCPGSALVSVNGKIYNLSIPIKIQKNSFVVPANFDAFFAKTVKSTESWQKLRKKNTLKRIVIDPGHGGKDPGGIGVKNIYEKNVVLDVSRRLKKVLLKEGIDVILTRDTDIFYSLMQRSVIANQAEADFFVSVHANIARTSSVHGFEVFYLSNEYDNFTKAVKIKDNIVRKIEKQKNYQYSADLNTVIWDMVLAENRIESIEMAKTISLTLKKMLNLKTRYIRGKKFAVLKNTNIPAVLLELGFLSNYNEAAKLSNPYYRQMLAEAIAAGIMRYKHKYELTNGFTI